MLRTPTGTFAFSNSQSMIESVIDRKTPVPDVAKAADAAKAAVHVDPGLGELPAFKAVASQLPVQSAAQRVCQPPPPRPASGGPTAAQQAGRRPNLGGDRALSRRCFLCRGRLELNDASIVTAVSKRSTRRYSTPGCATGPPMPGRWTRLCRIPPTALAHAIVHVDATAVLDAIALNIRDEDQPKLANVETLLSGLLLGRDLRTSVLPRLGPGVLAYFDAPAETDNAHAPPGANASATACSPFPLVLVVSLERDSNPDASRAMPAAVDNAFRTVLAALALDETRPRTSPDHDTHRGRLHADDLGPPMRFTYAVDRARYRLVLSTSSDAVARYLAGASGPNGGEDFRQIHARDLSGTTTYGWIDLVAVSRLAGQNRTELVQALAGREKRSVDDVERDIAPRCWRWPGSFGAGSSRADSMPMPASASKRRAEPVKMKADRVRFRFA